MHIVFDSWVKALKPDQPELGGSGQCAFFQISVGGSYTDSKGTWNIVGWNWGLTTQALTGLAIVNTTDPGGYTLNSPNYNTSTELAIAIAAGEPSAACTVTLAITVNGIESQQTKNLGDFCMVYGGPITISVNQTIGIPYSYPHDGCDPTQSYFLEYFGYDMVLYIPSQEFYIPTPTANSEWEQYVIAEVQVQPPGVVQTWWYPDFTDSCEWENSLLHPEDLDFDGPRFIDLYPSDAGVNKTAIGTNGLVICEFSGSWTDPQTGMVYTVPDIDDDTVTTRSDGIKGLPWINTVSTHEPNHLTVYDSNDDVPQRGPNDYGCYAGSDFWMQLIDQNGGLFPGAFVQESFPQWVHDDLPFFITNDGTQHWETILPTPIAPALTSPNDGEFNAADWLRFHWLTSWKDWLTLTIPHTYLAATADTTGVYGLHVETWNIVFTPSSNAPPATPPAAPNGQAVQTLNTGN